MAGRIKTAFSHSDPAAPEARFLGGAIDSLSPELIHKASPLYHIHPGMPPMLLQHGLENQLVPWQQSQIFYDKAKALGNDVTLELFENAQHTDLVFETPENMARVKRFLDRYMKQKTFFRK